MSQAWFVSGANRGIGLQLVKIIASNPDRIVFAGARNPSKATDLQDLASHNPNVHLVKLESTSTSDAIAAAETVRQVTGGLDVVIANAGIAQDWAKASEARIDAFNEHLQVNTIGPIILFQALYPLLLQRQTRKFVTVSTLGGSITYIPNLPLQATVYGTSKAALNFLTRSIHKEHVGEGFIVFPIHPGLVDTDMGQVVIPAFGGKASFISPVESAEGIFKVVDSATVEQAGLFLSYDGSELPW